MHFFSNILIDLLHSSRDNGTFAKRFREILLLFTAIPLKIMPYALTKVCSSVLE